jgi:Protein of unknown function (DUF1552)
MRASVLHRRRFLQALGLSALPLLGARAAWWRGTVKGDDSAPRRVVFICTAHGHVWNGWHLDPSQATSLTNAEIPLSSLAREDLSATLRPFHAIRDRVLAIEGLSHTSVLDEFRRLDGMTGIDLNNHNIAMAHLLCSQPALQRGPGVPCAGGGRSIDQELGARAHGDGRFDAPVWGANHALPYSYLDSGRAAPRVEDPTRIYSDLLGIYRPPSGGTPTLAERLEAERASVVDLAAREYDFVLARVGTEARKKLEDHRDFLRTLEASLSSHSVVSCDPDYDASSEAASRVRVSQTFDLAALALSCDLTRVVTIVPPILNCPDFGYPADADVHSNYAHSSVNDGGEPFQAISERAMIDYNVWYSQRVVEFLERLDSIREGSGTMLDHTAVVWLSELGSPTHQHLDACTLIAGGSDFFRLGRYVRYGRTVTTPFQWGMRDFRVGPSTSQLFTTLMRFMGHEDDSFGLAEAQTHTGELISLRGTLSELHA